MSVSPAGGNDGTLSDGLLDPWADSGDAAAAVSSAPASSTSPMSAAACPSGRASLNPPGWAAPGHDVQLDDPETRDDVDDGTNLGAQILDAGEPPNTSGFNPPVPDGREKLLNILEGPLWSAGILKPFHPYTQWVDQGVLMRGSEPDAKGFAALQAQGIKTVVNLRRESNDEKSTVEGLGMKNVWIPLYDQGVPSKAEVAAFLRVVNDPQNQPAMIHCEQGTGRTGLVSAVFRVAHDGWTADQAIAEAKQLGIKSGDQENFIREFASDWAAGQYCGQV